MGYRSSWKLAIGASSNEKLEEVLKHLQDASVDSKNPEDFRAVLKTILSSQESKTVQLVTFFDDYTKCYLPWDQAINYIINYCTEDEELDAAYACIGEETTDITTRSACKNLSIGINREFGDVDGECPTVIVKIEPK